MGLWTGDVTGTGDASAGVNVIQLNFAESTARVRSSLIYSLEGYTVEHSSNVDRDMLMETINC